MGPGERFFQDFRFGLLLFFALSGYLLFRPFAAAVLRDRELPATRGYLRNRALRILPVYWVILLATGLVLATAATHEGIGRMTSLHEWVADLLLVQNYDPDTVLTGIGPAWSLAVEVIFYLALPVLGGVCALLAARSRGPRGRLAAVIAAPLALFAMGLVGKAALANGVSSGSRWHAVATTAFPVHADLFAYGMAIAVAHVLIADRRLALPRGWRPAALILAAGGLLAAAVLAPSLGGRVQGAYTDMVAGISCALLLAAVVLPAEGATPLGARVLSIRPLAYIGLISYSVYLWHVPVILLLRRWGLESHDGPSLLAALAVILAATLSLSALTYHFVEAPALARKRPYAPRGATDLQHPVAAQAETPSVDPPVPGHLAPGSSPP
jgi:peptidoglycan/LPS O-acetylase OafA/YrhL